MSSTRWTVVVRALFTGMLSGSSVLWAQPTANPAAFSCPATVTVSETAVASVPWRAESGKTERRFSRPSIYNGTPGKQEFELAPDNQRSSDQRIRQDWKLAEYRNMNLFVRCHYAGTAATLVIDLPMPLQSCTFSFQNVTGKPPMSPVFECK